MNFEKSSGGICQSNKLKFSLIHLHSLEEIVTTLNTPGKSYLCRRFVKLFSNFNRTGSFKISPLIQDPGEPRRAYARKRDFFTIISYNKGSKDKNQ